MSKIFKFFTYIRPVVSFYFLRSISVVDTYSCGHTCKLRTPFAVHRKCDSGKEKPSKIWYRSLSLVHSQRCCDAFVVTRDKLQGRNDFVE